MPSKYKLRLVHMLQARLLPAFHVQPSRPPAPVLRSNLRRVLLLLQVLLLQLPLSLPHSLTQPLLLLLLPLQVLVLVLVLVVRVVVVLLLLRADGQAAQRAAARQRQQPLVAHPRGAQVQGGEAGRGRQRGHAAGQVRVGEGPVALQVQDLAAVVDPWWEVR